MSHGIVQPIDRVFSTDGPEWHGLAEQVAVINKGAASPLFFNIIQSPLSALVDGNEIRLKHHKLLVADYRTCRPDLIDHDITSGGLVPLHVPKGGRDGDINKGYRPISNRELWDAAERALAEVDATITCVGTLEAGKKFFISVNLNAGNDTFSANGDTFKAHLNLITSHDGTLGVRAYDSTVRIVCMNTLRWSLSAAGDVGFNVFHTANADVAMANLGALVNAVLTGRGNFRNTMEYLASIPCDAETARLVALGYLTQLNTDGAKVSKRSQNAAENIALLFTPRGAGNKGQTMYDLLNGATEYWTSGDGTGKKADAGVKAYKGQFGEAAEHKSAFANLLMNPDAIERAREAGKKAESVKLNADTAIG